MSTPAFVLIRKNRCTNCVSPCVEMKAGQLDLDALDHDCPRSLWPQPKASTLEKAKSVVAFARDAARSLIAGESAEADDVEIARRQLICNGCSSRIPAAPAAMEKCGFCSCPHWKLALATAHCLAGKW